MSDDATVQLQALLDRLRAGDREARREFLEQACGRLRRLAGKILSGSFPALQARHDVDSVVHETWLRLVQALDKSDPPTVADFFRLAAHKIRQVLLDMTERQRRIGEREAARSVFDGESPSAGDPADQTYDSARLAIWTEFHKQVDALPQAERAVFEMHYYLGLPQTEIAKLLELHPRKVSYLWIGATEQLAASVPELEQML